MALIESTKKMDIVGERVHYRFLCEQGASPSMVAMTFNTGRHPRAVLAAAMQYTSRT